MKVVAKSDRSLRTERKMKSMFALMLLSLVSAPSFAFTVPSSTSFGYAVYDIVIAKMLQGPLGWVGAALLVVWGISNIMKQWLITVVCIVGATCIIKVTTILTSLGAVLD